MQFHVGDWLVKPMLDFLERGGPSRKLEPRTMALLVYLARRSGEVVCMGDLIESVWGGRLVGGAAVGLGERAVDAAIPSKGR